jgi:hypothetical protein
MAGTSLGRALCQREPGHRGRLPGSLGATRGETLRGGGEPLETAF